MTTATQASRWWHAKRIFVNRLMWVLAILATLVAITPLVMVMYHVTVSALPALNWNFFTELPKPIGEAGGGMKNAIVGTLILIALASVCGLPFGILGGIYLAEFGNNRPGDIIRFTADVLASVPSIVVGILLYSLIVVTMKHYSALAGGMALGLMMIPTVMRSTEEIVRMVPLSQREAALSLGATHVKTIFTVVLTAARGGVITGALLAIARVAGETAPLMFTAGTNSFWSVDVNQPIASLPMEIYLRATAPYDVGHAQAWAGAFVLVALVLVLSIAARYATRGRFRLVR